MKPISDARLRELREFIDSKIINSGKGGNRATIRILYDLDLALTELSENRAQDERIRKFMAAFNTEY